MTNSSCFVSCWLQQRPDPRWRHAINASQTLDSVSFRDCFGTSHGLVRVMFDDPSAELLSYLCFTNAFEHLDARLAQNRDPLTIDARVWVSHPDHDSSHTAGGDRARTRGRATMKRARLERRVQSRADDALPARLCIAGRGDLGVVLARALGVTASNQRAARVHDYAADPRVIAGRAAREFCLFDREPHPRLEVVIHRPILAQMARLFRGSWRGSSRPLRCPVNR